ncbi:MAG: sensor histidine kinase N-terminal domain-containing protein [Proteobacteria bacterium]|uniref:sensor histidine kinase n=1 Tax=Rudaea sp. TaxID=2136325 RepID=UPI00321FAE98|nr:sensor histidine kinase N-terminal domain-containing protein [Pseudomonadota bacterium]
MAAARPFSVRRRLLLLLSAPLGLLLAAGVLIDYYSTASPLHAAYDQVLASSIVAVAAHLNIGADGRVKSELSDQAIAVLRADNHDEIYYLVLGADGEFVAGDAGLPIAPPGRENPSFADAEYRDAPVRVATYRLTNASGVIAISVAETTNKRREALHNMLSFIVASDLAQLLGTLLLVWVGVRAGLRPLLALRDQIARRSARDLAALDESQVPGEVRPLTRALNRLFATVAEAANAQHRFLANAAHQLRTPLAGLQAQLEVLSDDLRQQGASDPALRERVARLHAGMQRLGQTANQLLALARAEPAANLPGDFRELDLADLAKDGVAAHFDRALAARIDLGLEAEPVRAQASDWLLRELLANLIDNALAYTPAGGNVTVRCGVVRGPEKARSVLAFLEVEDDGRGIPEGERARVFERFYRIAGGEREGNGLGLAIVEEIARAHGATIELTAGAGGRGTRVRVSLAASVPGQG